MENKKKLTIDEVAELIFQMSEQYVILYFKAFKKDMDKQIWAALHVGFMTGMKQHGYTEKELDKALKIAQDELLS